MYAEQPAQIDNFEFATAAPGAQNSLLHLCVHAQSAPEPVCQLQKGCWLTAATCPPAHFLVPDQTQLLHRPAAPPLLFVSVRVKASVSNSSTLTRNATQSIPSLAQAAMHITVLSCLWQVCQVLHRTYYIRSLTCKQMVTSNRSKMQHVTNDSCVLLT